MSNEIKANPYECCGLEFHQYADGVEERCRISFYLNTDRNDIALIKHVKNDMTSIIKRNSMFSVYLKCIMNDEGYKAQYLSIPRHLQNEVRFDEDHPMICFGTEICGGYPDAYLVIIDKFANEFKGKTPVIMKVCKGGPSMFHEMRIVGMNNNCVLEFEVCTQRICNTKINFYNINNSEYPCGQLLCSKQMDYVGPLGGFLPNGLDYLIMNSTNDQRCIVDLTRPLLGQFDMNINIITSEKLKPEKKLYVGQHYSYGSFWIIHEWDKNIFYYGMGYDHSKDENKMNQNNQYSIDIIGAIKPQLSESVEIFRDRILSWSKEGKQYHSLIIQFDYEIGPLSHFYTNRKSSHEMIIAVNSTVKSMLSKAFIKVITIAEEKYNDKDGNIQTGLIRIDQNYSLKSFDDIIQSPEKYIKKFGDKIIGPYAFSVPRFGFITHDILYGTIGIIGNLKSNADVKSCLTIWIAFNKNGDHLVSGSAIYHNINYNPFKVSAMRIARSYTSELMNRMQTIISNACPSITMALIPIIIRYCLC